eukprot:m.69763 g.69763  ORF g.69763 m.69763 type:complete len:301 (+) comp7562_c0_seq2:331-1233(+)
MATEGPAAGQRREKSKYMKHERCKRNERTLKSRGERGGARECARSSPRRLAGDVAIGVDEDLVVCIAALAVRWLVLDDCLGNAGDRRAGGHALVQRIVVQQGRLRFIVGCLLGDVALQARGDRAAQRGQVARAVVVDRVRQHRPQQPAVKLEPARRDVAVGDLAPGLPRKLLLVAAQAESCQHNIGGRAEEKCGQKDGSDGRGQHHLVRGCCCVAQCERKRDGAAQTGPDKDDHPAAASPNRARAAQVIEQPHDREDVRYPGCDDDAERPEDETDVDAMAPICESRQAHICEDETVRDQA